MLRVLLVLVMMAVTTTAEGATDCQGADIDGNGKVDFTDFTILAAKFGTTDCDTPACAELLARIEALENRIRELENTMQNVVLHAVGPNGVIWSQLHIHAQPSPSSPPPPPQPAANACEHLKEVFEHLSRNRYGRASDTLRARVGERVFDSIQNQVNQEYDPFSTHDMAFNARVFAIADSVLQCNNAGPYVCLYVDDVARYYSGVDIAQRLDDKIGEPLHMQIRQAVIAAFQGASDLPTVEQVESVVKPIMGCQ